jgi:hypothetical protein
VRRVKERERGKWARMVFMKKSVFMV